VSPFEPGGTPEELPWLWNRALICCVADVSFFLFPITSLPDTFLSYYEMVV